MAPGQAHYLQDPMHGVPRTAYPREYYAQAMPSGPYVRERILSYSQPDMRVSIRYVYGFISSNIYSRNTRYIVSRNITIISVKIRWNDSPITRQFQIDAMSTVVLLAEYLQPRNMRQLVDDLLILILLITQR